MKEKFILLYIDVAQRIAQLSHARRLKVGAVIVKDHRILSYGYNGTPAGFDNNCEILEETYDVRDTYVSSDWIYSEETKKYSRLKTKPEVIHAEMNAIAKVAKHGDSCDGAFIFLTHAPCVECAKMICQTGIKQVYYKDTYRSTSGIKLLNESDIKCEIV